MKDVVFNRLDLELKSRAGRKYYPDTRLKHHLPPENEKAEQYVRSSTHDDFASDSDSSETAHKRSQQASRQEQDAMPRPTTEKQ